MMEGLIEGNNTPMVNRITDVVMELYNKRVLFE